MRKLELAVDIIMCLDVLPENIPSFVGGRIGGVNWYRASFRIETTNVLSTLPVKGVPHVGAKNLDWF